MRAAATVINENVNYKLYCFGRATCCKSNIRLIRDTKLKLRFETIDEQTQLSITYYVSKMSLVLRNFSKMRLKHKQ